MAERTSAITKTPETKKTCSNSCKQNVCFNSSGPTSDMILQLQRTAGNRAVQKLIKSGALQTKFKISQPNDIYEQEAGKVAERVLRTPDLVIQRKSTKCNEDKKNVLQAKDPSEAVKGTKKDMPVGEVLSMDNVVPIEGDPISHPNYIQNVIKGVGISGWGGPFRLDRKIVNGMGIDSINLPRNEFKLDNDPLKDTSIFLNNVYKSRASADAALKKFGTLGTYTFYIGLGGHIFPTVISDTTAPALCASLRKAIEVEKTDAEAAANLSFELALWYMGARAPIKSKQKMTNKIEKTTLEITEGVAKETARLPRSGLIPRSVGAMSRAEAVARKLNLNANSPTTRQVLNSLDDTVADFIGAFRKGSIKGALPSEVLNMTVEKALNYSSKVRKLLIDKRFAK